MVWLRGWPDGRVFALVLWDYDPYHVPFVGQYEPISDKWVSETKETYQPTECMYAELPYHKSFNEKTHLFTKKK